MNITDVIRELQNIREEEGDLTVVGYALEIDVTVEGDEYETLMYIG